MRLTRAGDDQTLRRWAGGHRAVYLFRRPDCAARAGHTYLISVRRAD